MVVVPDNIDIEIGDVRLRALVGVPENAEGLVIFAHGSGSGRLSPRNNQVAVRLREAGLAQLVHRVEKAAAHLRPASRTPRHF